MTKFTSSLFEIIPEINSRKFRGLISFCETHHCLVLFTLPKVAAEIAYFCGYMALFKLIRNHGGTKTNIMGNLKYLQKRENLEISTEKYLGLKKSLGSGSMDLPSAGGVFFAIRTAAIFNELALTPQTNPASIKKITKKFGVSERYLRKILKEVNDKTYAIY